MKILEYTVDEDTDFSHKDLEQIMVDIQKKEKERVPFLWKGMHLTANPRHIWSAQQRGLNFWVILDNYLSKFSKFSAQDAVLSLYREQNCEDEYEENISTEELEKNVSSLIEIAIDEIIFKLCTEKEEIDFN